MKKALKLTLLVVMSVCSALLLYATIGYLILAIKTPILYSLDGNTHFMGMYMMSATYFTGFVLFIVALTLYIKYVIKNKNKS